jgi:hypothetical protein
MTGPRRPPPHPRAPSPQLAAATAQVADAEARVAEAKAETARSEAERGLLQKQRDWLQEELQSVQAEADLYAKAAKAAKLEATRAAAALKEARGSGTATPTAAAAVAAAAAAAAASASGLPPRLPRGVVRNRSFAVSEEDGNGSSGDGTGSSPVLRKTAKRLARRWWVALLLLGWGRKQHNLAAGRACSDVRRRHAASRHGLARLAPPRPLPDALHRRGLFPTPCTTCRRPPQADRRTGGRLHRQPLQGRGRWHRAPEPAADAGRGRCRAA